MFCVLKLCPQRLRLRGLAHLYRHRTVAVVCDLTRDAVLAVVVLGDDLFGLARGLGLLIQHVHRVPLDDASRRTSGQQHRRLIVGHGEVDGFGVTVASAAVSSVAVDRSVVFSVVDFDVDAHVCSFLLLHSVCLQPC